MEISWGFFIILVLILFPGLLIRRLYYYGEFSKQFASGYSLIKLISVASIPGFLNLVFTYCIYDSYVVDIDIGKVIDTMKDISNPKLRLQDTPGITLKEALQGYASPFLGFVYLSSILIGTFSGRVIRNSRIDTRFKILRFRNYWFYLLTGEHTQFKKMRHLRNVNSKHLFTKADILIDISTGTHLYSGIVVDYELNENDCQVLSKVMLHKAERYAVGENGRRVPTIIPGNILVVDCSSMKNINLTFVNQRKDKSKRRAIVDILFSITFVFLIPFFIFQIDIIEWELYKDYFNKSWYNKLFFFLLVVQILSLFNPYTRNKKTEEYELIKWTTVFAKVFWVLLLCVLICLF